MRSSLQFRFFHFCALFSCLLFADRAIAQLPGVQWQKCYGGSTIDGANCVLQAPDGGFVVGGYSNSPDGQVTGNHGALDCWVVKTDATGNVVWQHSYGGSADDFLNQMIVDENGGYVFAASTISNDGDVTGNHGGGGDGWLVKIDDTGHIVWQKVMGSSGFDFFDGIINTPDSGYLAIGAASANDGDITGLYGNADVWVVKLSKTGAVSWSKVYGGPNYDYGFSAVNTPGGGYLVVANVYGSGGLVTTDHGISDSWLLRLNDTGGVVWQHSYGGSAAETGGSILQQYNGNYLVGCSSASTNGDVTGNHGSNDFWIYSVNDTGALLWEKSYGGSGNEQFGESVVQTYDSGIVFTGLSSLLNGEVTSDTHAATGGSDFWMVKIDDTGAIKWENAFGGTNLDSGVSVVQTFDSGYAVTGGTTSNNIDVSGNHGQEDYWLIKLAKDPPVKVIRVLGDAGVKVYPTLTNGLVFIELPPSMTQAKFTLTDMAGHSFTGIVDGLGLKKSLNISAMHNGVYLLSVTDAASKYTFELVLNR